MKIEALEWLQVGRWFYLLVHTEEGITGLGEGACTATLRPSGASWVLATLPPGAGPAQDRAPLAVPLPQLPLRGR